MGHSISNQSPLPLRKKISTSLTFLWKSTHILGRSIEKPNQTKIYVAYGTAQLQGNIYTRPSCVSEASCTNSSFIWQKGCGSYVSFAEALSQGFVLAHTHLVCAPDVSCAHPRRVSHAFQTRVNVILELSCTVFWSLTSEIWPVDFWSNNLYCIIQTAIT